jgi:hypothetical protein
MPGSRPNAIPAVIHILRQLRPQSILDVGVGFGKWGHLFREYTDINAAENDPPRYHKAHWQVRIDGIEGHPGYLTDMHRFLYDEIHVGDACQVLPALPEYDLVFMGDIIEHLDKGDGRRLLEMALAKARQAVLVSTPKYETHQSELCGNELERHRSLWSAADFKKFPGATVRTIDGDTLLALLLKAGMTPVGFQRANHTGTRERRLLEEARQILIDWIAVETPFVLIDDEQIRSQLPHRHCFPFLEKEGTYWGPPAEDETAIGELERLKARGAKYVAIVSSSFWWLERYPKFAAHLKDKHSLVEEDESLIAYALR